ncbi:hypothetical protein L3Q82_001560 [Scortum barcoo]|uniref:Uncharacterized protein n=1 Tax=Scortum barcoo TaxID=214431 RepID=A0ACB8W898_9TELE|nr:hypothetical protein L3Q82_001560 [Scortum barcoo]
MVTEVRGFTDPQKEEYFRKRFRDEEQASRIISHIKTSRSLHIMCHIPVFCWITATVLEDVLKTREGGELPKTLTEMYIHFLVVQLKLKNVKYHRKSETDPHWSPESRKMIESLGKLAFEQLQKGNLIFYESDLTECGIDIRAASVYSGVFTQIFKEERGLYQDKVFCFFVHLSVQEFLAALHVHLTFINSGVNLLSEEQSTSWLSNFFRDKPKLQHLYQSAVDKALQSPNGHLDLFLRFLLGLSLQTNQTLLRGLLTQTGSSSQTNQETVEYIKKKLNNNLSGEKSINLFHCLNELNDRSLVEEIQQSLRSGSLSTDKLSPAQWSALVFILLSSEKDLDVFDLKKYSASEEALLRLLPVVKASNKALLSGCLIREEGCASLASALKLQPLPSERAGPELQPSRRLRSEAAVCWIGESTLETGRLSAVINTGIHYCRPSKRILEPKYPTVFTGLGKLKEPYKIKLEPGAKSVYKAGCHLQLLADPIVGSSSESRFLTTFITPFGRYAFNHLPFEISSAPEHFQRRMSQMLEGCDGVVCHADDIVVYGDGVQQHNTRLHQVLKRLKEEGLTLNDK